jgi:osmotically-inducible protein OsmY
VKKLALLALLAVLVSGLTGCAQLAIKAVSVGAGVAIDRRTAGSQLEDETIQLRAASALGERLAANANISVTSYNRQVLLTGEVPDAASKQAVEQTVGQLENVSRVFNELAVMNASTLAQRGFDAYLTGRVKVALVDARGLTVTAFRVVTERGTVYLMGRVTPLEAERATALVRQIGGVQRIVRLFEIINE